MDLGRLAPVLEVAGEDIPYHLRKGMVCQLKNGMVCPLRPLRPELDGQDPFQISGLLCQTRKTPTLTKILDFKFLICNVPAQCNLPQLSKAHVPAQCNLPQLRKAQNVP
jgi:hypothetical protein